MTRFVGRKPRDSVPDDLGRQRSSLNTLVNPACAGEPPGSVSLLRGDSGMICRRIAVLSLGVAIALAAIGQRASAQRVARSAYQDRGMSPAVRTNAGAQPETYTEELPPG